MRFAPCRCHSSPSLTDLEFSTILMKEKQPSHVIGRLFDVIGRIAENGMWCYVKLSRAVKG